MILTVDKNFGRCLQLLPLAQSSVPDGTSVNISVIFLGRNNSQNWLSWFILIDSGVKGRINRLRLAFGVPVDLRRGRSAQRGAGQVEGSSFRGSGCRRRDGRLRRLQQDRQLNWLRMKFISGSALFHPAFELTIVAIVSGLTDSQVINAAFRKMFNPENNITY